MKIKITLIDLKTDNKISHEFELSNKLLNKKTKDVNNNKLGDELFILIQRLKKKVEKK